MSAAPLAGGLEQAWQRPETLEPTWAGPAVRERNKPLLVSPVGTLLVTIEA